jgi:hypothetical protein
MDLEENVQKYMKWNGSTKRYFGRNVWKEVNLGIVMLLRNQAYSVVARCGY